MSLEDEIGKIQYVGFLNTKWEDHKMISFE